MKRVFSLLLMLALLPVGLAFSQKAFADLGFSYGFGAGTQRITNTLSGGTVTGVYGSYGEGIRFGATGGYMFSKNFGAQFGFMYIIGKSFDGDAKDAQGNNFKQTFSGSGFVVAPGVIFSTGMDKIEPYARMALALGFLKQTFVQTGPNSEYNSNTSGGLTLGFITGVGAAYNLTRMFGVYAEITMVSMTQNPSTSEITKDVVNGQTQPDQGKKIDYKDTFTLTQNNQVPENTALSVRNPFSSVGITIGGRVNF
jgi:hypothetical protein